MYSHSQVCINRNLTGLYDFCMFPTVYLTTLLVCEVGGEWCITKYKETDISLMGYCLDN